MSEPITAELLLLAYARGIFPMSESRDDPEIFWVDPRFRGVLPLDNFHLSRSLARHIRQGAANGSYEVTLDRDFSGVLDGCADRPDTWINCEIRRLYLELHALGHAHSIEIWSGDNLAGGIYGVTLGRAFFGESMFSRATNASKTALAFLVVHLQRCGFTLFDTQFLTPHLAGLGAEEIPRTEYHRRLSDALQGVAEFGDYSDAPSASSVLQPRTQTS